jgi:Chaperone of endosialidase
MNPSPLRRGFPVVLIAIGLACFALTPTARAVDPPPDGGYPNGNTAEGTDALFSLENGFDNTAIGFNALFNLTSGSANTATGAGALYNSTTGVNNTANGAGALGNTTNGSGNTANGTSALVSNTTGSGNTANGYQALALSTTGSSNTPNGWNALLSNTTGSSNTASGTNSLKSNTTAFNNTANGQASLANNTTGGSNTAAGYHALLHNTTGSSNIALGSTAGMNLTTGNNNIDIGNGGIAGDANMIRIGKQGTQAGTFVAGIRGVTVASGVGVVVGSNGQLGTVTSSARFKEAIKPMDKASEAILALKPVTFHYKHELDPDGIPQFGLVAEQVEKVNPDLVVRGEDGEVMTVRYEAVNAMLLNEFLKQHRNVAEQQSTIAELKTMVAQQQKQIEALTATVQKVSDQVALSNPAPQLVANH